MLAGLFSTFPDQLCSGAPASDATRADRLHFCLPACYATVRSGARSSEVLKFILA